MADDSDNDKMRIYEVNKPDGDELLLCYFKPKSNGTYTFHNPEHVKKADDITFDKPFTCKLHDDQPTEWTLTLEPDSTDPIGKKYRGTWSKSNDNDPTLEDGTYQAQAGGTLGEDAASAYA
jgi:hypothetical protein